jgi:hypothetical protein
VAINPVVAGFFGALSSNSTQPLASKGKTSNNTLIFRPIKIAPLDRLTPGNQTFLDTMPQSLIMKRLFADYTAI